MEGWELLGASPFFLFPAAGMIMLLWILNENREKIRLGLLIGSQWMMAISLALMVANAIMMKQMPDHYCAITIFGLLLLAPVSIWTYKPFGFT